MNPVARWRLDKDDSNQPDAAMTAAAVNAAKSADVVIYVGGISAQLEGEEMTRANGFIGFSGGDRTQIELPSVQTDLLKALYNTGKPVVFVDCSGSAIAMPWEAKKLPAILQAWYPGPGRRTGGGRSAFWRCESRRAAAGHLLPFHERPAAV